MELKLVKATVVQEFFDKENRGLVLKVGQTIERSKERITFLESKGLVKAENNVAEKVEKPKTKGK